MFDFESSRCSKNREAGTHINNELFFIDRYRLYRCKAFLSFWKGTLMVGSFLGAKSETPQTWLGWLIPQCTTLVFWFKGKIGKQLSTPESLNMCFFGRSRGSLSDPISNFKWNLLCAARSIMAHNLPSNSSVNGMIMAVGTIVRSSMGEMRCWGHTVRMIYLAYIYNIYIYNINSVAFSEM